MTIESLQAFSDQVAEVVQSAGKSAVRVDARQRIAGTGIVWGPDVILTADHVVEREEEIAVSVDGNSFMAELVGRDPPTDVAALRIKGGNLTPAAQGDPQALKVGHLVIAIGRPWSTEAIVSVGFVSGKGSSWVGRHTPFREGLIQADVTLYPGFSGGPLVDASGRMVGMNSSVLGRGMALAIPTDTVSRVMAALLKEGRVRRGHLGVGLQLVPISDKIAAKLTTTQERGLMILTVEPGSAAEAAGLLPGDILVRIGDQALVGLEDLQRALTADRIGQPVDVTVIRGGDVKHVSVVVGAK